jgi:hypothetical protein
LLSRLREETRTDQHEQQAQPVPQEKETQPTQDSQAASEQPAQTEQEKVEIAAGVPVIYLTTSGGI